MALIHKTKKEEGKKHKTKKKTQKKQKIFRIELRKDRFRMFGPYSKPISAISVASRYNPIRPIQPNSSRIGPVWCESKPNQRKSERERERKRKKKKKAQTRHRCAAVRCGTLPTASVFQRQTSPMYSGWLFFC